MDFHVTVRHGHRYHLITVTAEDAAAAMVAAAHSIPADILPSVDLVEVRRGIDGDARPYLGSDPPPPPVP
jgi:hypothetical protein